ncbi:MAG: NUDIX domain-containing protein [Betaproteobacteria bacterium]|nr:NUDIX domain-containing protein [Betaproteobacteria bacterium]
MELNSEIPTAPPRDAATVVILRDGAQGLEVFLVKRHGLSDVLGGAYVFPGGKLDAADCAPDTHRHLDQDRAQLHAALGEPGTAPDLASGLFVAALRETYEEAGVLFAHGADVRLQTQAVHPWSRWITPRMPSVTNKRFDTRFFIAVLPPGQQAAHDNVEATESAWLRPRAALEQYWAREIELAPPQIMSLAHLARYSTAAEAMAQARSQLPPLIMPEAFQENDERVICYPGHPRHPVPARALPGPLQLFWRNKRFEPAGGFDALFA